MITISQPGRTPLNKAMFSVACQIVKGAQKCGNANAARKYVDALMDFYREDLSPVEFTALQKFMFDYVESGKLNFAL